MVAVYWAAVLTKKPSVPAAFTWFTGCQSFHTCSGDGIFLIFPSIAYDAGFMRTGRSAKKEVNKVGFPGFGFTLIEASPNFSYNVPVQ
jgi:hypothetical protein